MEIKIKKLHEKAVIPEYQTKGAACFDLVATEIVYYSSYEDDRIVVKFGLSSEIPEGYKVVIVPRSGFTHKGWTMQNTPGQVDSDYRGEWMVKLQAIPTGITDSHFAPKLTYDEFPYKVGERCFQAYIEKVEQCSFVEVKDLAESERGSGGFGSTGAK